MGVWYPVGERVEQDSEVEDDACAKEDHLVVGTSLVGAVDNMELLGHKEIKQLKGNDCYGCDDVIHSLLFYTFQCAKVQLFFGVYGFFCIFAKEINIYIQVQDGATV